MPRVSHELLEAICDQTPVGGLTHSFYKYPARFSPKFAREIIRHFSKPGDVVFDPFVGGGTTLVEARSLGRLAIGIDVNTLATFITKVKTTKLSKNDIVELEAWGDAVVDAVNLHRESHRPDEWIDSGYQININSRNTWPIRKSIELFLEELEGLSSERQKAFARCVLLATSQWALDCRSSIPTTREFRQMFSRNMAEMLFGAQQYAELVLKNKLEQPFGRNGVICLNASVVEAHKLSILQKHPPNLIVTSPPYPATHVLYHRWQVQGRKETKAPFWIANEQDGHFAPYYCMGERRRQGNDDYFENMEKAFDSISQIVNSQTLVVQMVAFPDPSFQLPRYLKLMRDAGFKEIKMGPASFGGRLWRTVPNRKFYAGFNGYGTANEVVLFHRLED